MKTNIKSYDNGIAIAKGFGIIFMVIGHCSAVPYHGGNSLWQTYISQYIYLFHMPLFFFLSGYFFKFSHIYNKKLFVKKKIDGLWKPYVKWGLFFVLIHNILHTFGLYSAFHGPEPTQYSLGGIFYNCAQILLLRGGDQLIGGFWFIPVLFRSAICAMLTLWAVGAALDLAVIYAKELQEKYPLLSKPLSLISLAAYGNRNVEIKDMKCHELRVALLSFGMLAIGAILLLSINRMPSVGHTFLASAIFMAGFITSRITIINHKIWKIGFVVIGTVLCACISVLYPTSFATGGFWGTLRTLTLGCIGTWTWVIISRAIAKRRGMISEFLIYVGKNTMIVLALHFSCFKIVNALKIYYYDLPNSQIGAFPIISDDPSGNGMVWFILYLIVGVVLPITIMRLYEKSRFSGKL